MSNLRTAYLVSQYPKLSHAFIEREIRALRGLGVEVQTFSVRPAAEGDLLTDADRDEAAHTVALLQSKGDVARAVLRLGLRHPGALVRGLSRAARTGPRTVRSRLWQVFYLAEAALLVEKCGEAGIRHLHVHLANNGADVARAAVALGRDVDRRPWSWSLSMHGPTEFYDVEAFDLAAKVEGAAFVACISDFCRSQLMMLVEPQHWDKLRIVHMGVDLDRYPLLTTQRAGRTGPLRVLFVGRLTSEKAPQVLVEAAAQLPRGSVEVRIVGAGAARTALERSVVEAGMADVISILGPKSQDQLLEQYGWADVFCLPSFAEGVPVVLMEAMATGLPVLTTQIAGIPELVEHGVNGVLVAPGRADLLAHALRTLADDEEHRIELGTRGRATVEQGFTPGPNAAVLRGLLHDAVATDGQGQRSAPATPVAPVSASSRS